MIDNLKTDYDTAHENLIELQDRVVTEWAAYCHQSDTIETHIRNVINWLAVNGYLNVKRQDNPLDQAWHLINSEGGVDPKNEYNKAIGDALAIIEDLGGMDPLQRKRDNGRFGVGA